MKLLRLILALIFSCIIAGIYALFQHYFFDTFFVMPLIVSLIITLLFTRMVTLSRYKMIVCSILLGLMIYSVFIGCSYQLFKSNINEQAKTSINYEIDDITDKYLYYMTGHKGIVGYVFLRTESIPSNMVQVMERVKKDNIEIPNLYGFLGEIFRFAIMVFLPLLAQLQPNSRRVTN